MTDQKKPAYGGQAVVEGVMFAGKNTYVTAIRRNDDSIDYYEVLKPYNPWMNKIKKVPFLRGIAAILEASSNGTKHLNFSTERYNVTPGEELKKEEPASSKAMFIFSLAVVGVLTFLFGKFVFTLVPVFLAEAFRPWVQSHVGQNLLEGLFKFLFLLSYIYFVSMTPTVKRVFQYHGAEHKVINAYENGCELTVDNVKKQSRLHYRCGSSFILFTVVVGVFVYLFVPSDPLWQRVIYRVVLIPVVLGISFEVLQITNKLRNIPVLRYLGYPGLWLQLLTTKEPDRKQTEVAILSFTEMMRRDEEHEKRKIENTTKIV
ncbi:DUF1385 domain-containing protein [Fictibacillus fluitans]|uniref:DUF1385 domain-containing protein n=1 Tax=Fictibacillus fluitans TaxID=3058422 RepID=A0ABT8HWX3_9BACL|nr:DUF1385 domain-containing protein [Fictibacillus sp. NE201]MDN4525284.1 DUF1385 domain-containing protein [Fictibacillus sp. NE201]